MKLFLNRNPNEPVQLPSHIPEWPQFNTETMQFMELNSAEFKIVTTPNKERLDEVRNDLFSARIQQILSDTAPVFGKWFSTVLATTRRTI